MILIVFTSIRKSSICIQCSLDRSQNKYHVSDIVEYCLSPTKSTHVLLFVLVFKLVRINSNFISSNHSMNINDIALYLSTTVKYSLSSYKTDIFHGDNSSIQIRTLDYSNARMDRNLSR